MKRFFIICLLLQGFVLNQAISQTKIISGTITRFGNPLSGVSVALSVDTVLSTTTNGTGDFSFTVDSNKNYVITPTLAGYTFSPATITINNLTNNSLANNFAAVPDVHSLTGSLTAGGLPLNSVTVSVDTNDNAGHSGSYVLTLNGSYSISANTGSSYTITPTKTGYTFSPLNHSFASVSGNGNQDFTATLNQYRISGVISLGGSPQTGVTVTLSNGKDSVYTTAADGAYSFYVNALGNYTVTPTKANYTFSPASQSFNNVTSSQTQNFTSTLNTWTISGTITLGGSPQSGVSVSCPGANTATPITTDGTGTYTFTVNAAGNYTVTPTKANYTFSPVSQTFNNVTSNQTQDFTSTLNTWTISGTITLGGSPQSGVSVSCPGANTATPITTDGTGTYTFTVNAAGNYTVTPTKTGYTYSPINQSFNNVTSNATQNFTGTLDQFKISGVVSVGGSPQTGVTVTLSNGKDSVYTTAADGAYSFYVNALGSYTVTPAKTGYTYSPVNQSFNNVLASATQNFTGTLNQHRISGIVSVGGSPQTGVTVTLSNGKDSVYTTAADGAYSFYVNALGNYTVTPAKTGYTYSPVNQSFNNITSSSTQNFTGTINQYKISGVVSVGGSPQTGVTVTLSNGKDSVYTTAADGAYSFYVNALGNYTVTPTKTGYTYSPLNQSFNNVLASATQNFTGTLDQHRISGVVSVGGSPQTGATVTLSNGKDSVYTTAADGAYSFYVNALGNYTVTPTKTGYTYSPQNQSFNSVTSNTTQNFTGTLDQYKISGVVSVGGSPQTGVTVTLSNGKDSVYTTAADGAYSFYVNALGNYTVTPAKTGYTYSPVNQAFNNVLASATQNFTGTLNQHRISGVVSVGGSPQTGVTVTLSSGKDSVYTTVADGAYSFYVNALGNYIVTPTKTGYNYSPVNQSFNNITSNASQNFTGILNTYTLSGTIRTATLGLSGVNLRVDTNDNLGHIGFYNRTVDSTYSIIGNHGSTYTIYLTKIGYTFNPVSYTFGLVTGPGSQNFTGTLDQHRISGVVSVGGSPQTGVAVTLSNGKDSVYTTAADGAYSFYVNALGNYTVTPTKTGYTYSPINQAFNNVLASATQNFTGTLNQHRISGIVSVGGSPQTGATVTLSNGKDSVYTTAADGAYSFYVNALGNYTVTPTKTGYNYSPVNQSFNNITSNSTQNFTGVLNTYTLSGTVRTATLGLSGVNLRVDTNDNLGHIGFYNRTVDSTYSIIGNHGSTYTVYITKTGYTFNPTSYTFGLITGPGAQNFTGTLDQHKISGIVSFGGSPQTGVTVTLSGGKDSIYATAADGAYSFYVNALGNYIVKPTKAAYSYSPDSAIFTNVLSSQTQNFTATRLTYSISGYVKVGTTAIPNVVLTLTSTGIPKYSVLSDATGYFIINNVGGDSSFTLSASKNGWLSFAPGNYNYTPLIANQTNQDFQGTRAIYSIGGTITGSGNPIANVTVSLVSGGITKYSTLTLGDGTYQFNGIGGDSVFTVHPARSGWSFNSDTTINPLISNSPAINFVGTRLTYSISGKATSGGVPISNVTIYLYSSGILKYSTATNGTGDFTFNIVGGDSNFVMSAAKAGWASFAPDSFSYVPLIANQTNQNFSGTRGLYTIGGNISGSGTNIPNVLVSLGSGGTTIRTTYTDSSGNYSFGNVGGDSNFTVSVYKAGWVFGTDSTITALYFNHNAVNFNGIRQHYTISGTITVTGPSVFANATISLISNGTTIYSTLSAWNGTYSFTNVGGDSSFVVHVSRPGWNFGTDSTINNLSFNHTNVNFFGIRQVYTISGTIRDSIGLTPIQNVLVSLNNGTGTRTILTAANGTYSFTNVGGDSNYTIHPTRGGWKFGLDSIYSNLGSNKTTTDFIGVRQFYQISGTVLTGSGVPIVNVSVSLICNSTTTKTVLSDSLGNYVFNNVGGDSIFTVHPSRPGWSFSSDVVLSSLSGNVSSVAFVGTRLAFSISGKALSGGNPIQNVAIYLKSNGILKYSALTNGTGDYTFTNIGGDSSFVMTAAKAGWASFAPDSFAYNPLSANQTIQNFVGTRGLYSIGGNVASSGTNIANVTVSLINGTTTVRTTYTDSSGNYTFANVGGDSNFTVRATKGGWVFGTDSTITSLYFNHNAVNFIGVRQYYTISGTITGGGNPIQNVFVVLKSNGITTHTTQTAANGTYSFTNIGGDSNFVVHPTRVGWLFGTDSTFNNLSANHTTVNFVGTRQYYSVSGTIRDSSTLNPLQNVQVTLDNGYYLRTAMTNALGQYQFSQVGGDSNYTVHPYKAGWKFGTDSIYLNLGSDKLTTNYLGVRQSYQLTGIVNSNSGGTIKNVLMSLINNGITVKTTLTDSVGIFTFTNVSGDSNYTISPFKKGWIFTPDFTTTSLGANISNITFAGTRQYYTISGTTSGTTVGLMANVTVNLKCNGVILRSALSGFGGTYSFTSVAGDSTYVVSPVRGGWNFGTDSTITDLGENHLSVNFVGTRQKYSISGTITGVGYGPIQNLTVLLLSNGVTKYSTLTDVNGIYLFTNVGGDSSFVIRAQKGGWSVGLDSIIMLSSNRVVDFALTRGRYLISGYIRDSLTNNAIVSATVSLISNGLTKYTTTSGSDGGYGFNLVGGDSTFTVHPSKAGWTFNRDSIITNLSADLYSVNLFGSINKYRITGTITESGVPVSSVVVTISGGKDSVATTNSSGTFSFTVNAASSYTIYPNRYGYTFTPLSKTFTTILGDSVINFTGVAPDLVVVSPAGNVLSINSVEPTQSITITARVRNIGTANAGTSVLKYYVSKTRAVDSASATKLGEVTIPALAVGQTSSDISLSILSFPTYIKDTVYYAGFICNGSRSVPERDTLNNDTTFATDTLRVLWKSDLIVVEDAIEPQQTSPDQTVTIMYRVSNIGLGKSITSISTFYLSLNTNQSVAGDIKIASVNIPVINAGSTYSNQSISLTIPHTLAKGIYHVKAFADSGNKVSEAYPGGENNNFTLFGYLVKVRYSNLSVTFKEYWPTESGVGDTLQIRTWISNIDSGASIPTTIYYYITPGNNKRAPNPATDYLLGFRNIPALSWGEIFRDTSNWVIPSMSTGFHYVGYIMDRNNIVKESNEADSADYMNNGYPVGLYIQTGLTVMTDECSFTPEVVGQGDTLTVSSKVANFNSLGTSALSGDLYFFFFRNSPYLNTRISNVKAQIRNLLPTKDTIITTKVPMSESTSPIAPTGTYNIGFRIVNAGAGAPSSASNYKATPLISHSHDDAVLWYLSSFSPDTISQGLPFTITTVIRNLGTTTSATRTVRFYLNTTTDMSTATLPTGITWQTTVNPISPKTDTTITYTVASFPGQTAVPLYPNYYVGFDMFVTNPRYYYITSPSQLSVSAAMPDLAATTATIQSKTSTGQVITNPDLVLAGDSIIINANFENQFSGTVNKDFVVKYYLIDSTDVANFPLTNYLGQQVVNASTNNIPGFSQQTLPTFRCRIPTQGDAIPVPWGTYYVGWWIDANNDINPERSKNNNKYPKTFVGGLKVGIHQDFFFTFGGQIMFASKYNSAKPGSTIEIPINMDKIDGINTVRYKFTLKYNDAVVRLSDDPIIAGRLCKDWILSYTQDSSGVITIEANGFGQTAISDSGTLLKIKFDIIGSVGQSSPLIISNFKVNGSWPLTVENSRIFINDGTLKVLDNLGLPLTYKLEQNYPNPFNPTTTIRYSIPEASSVKIIIYDALGREVRVIRDQKLSMGWYEDTFDARNLSSGVYFYRIQTTSNVSKTNFNEIKKMLLLK